LRFGNRFALRFGALGFFGGSRSGAFAVLGSAVGTHGEKPSERAMLVASVAGAGRAF